MKNNALFSSFIFGIVLFILNYEYFYINAEGIFILSFLLFTSAFYFFAGDMIGDLLDTTSLEISKKIKEVSLLQKQSLQETKKTLNSLKTLQVKIIPLFIFTISTMEHRENLLIRLQQNIYKNFLERKLKEILLEATTVNSLFSQKAAKEIIDLYEKKIKKKKKK